MFFENSRIRFFKLVNSIVNNIERISAKIHSVQEYTQHSLVFKVLR